MYPSSLTIVGISTSTLDPCKKTISWKFIWTRHSVFFLFSTEKLNLKPRSGRFKVYLFTAKPMRRPWQGGWAKGRLAGQIKTCTGQDSDPINVEPNPRPWPASATIGLLYLQYVHLKCGHLLVLREQDIDVSVVEDIGRESKHLWLPPLAGRRFFGHFESLVIWWEEELPEQFTLPLKKKQIMIRSNVFCAAQKSLSVCAHCAAVTTNPGRKK